LKLILKDVESALWNVLMNDYRFAPDVKHLGEWICIPDESKAYHKACPFGAGQECLINSFLEALIDGEMYALDWQHDCFLYSPGESIPFEYEYYDYERRCQVYFPTYYPNGDYHLFFDKEWRYGLFGHPWRHEIVVMGKELIDKFEENKKVLGLDD